MKKSIKIILLMLLIMCVTAISAFAAEDNTAYQHLVNMGLMQYNDETFEEGAVLTRAQLAVVISNIYGGNTTFTKYFNDVSKTTFGAAEISNCVQLGLMVGDGNTNFRPDDPVSVAELNKIMVDMLGYKARAEIKGGYPFGYYTVAAELKIATGIDSSAEALICRDAAKVIFNTLKSDVVVQNVYGDRNTWSETGESLMYRVMGLDYKKGMVDGTPLAQFAAEGTVGKRYITIDGEAFEANGIEDYFLLGNEVEAVYVADADKTTEIVSIVSIGTDNILTVYPKDISSASSTEIKYYEDGARYSSKADISQNANWFLNYAAVLSYDIANFKNLDSAKLVMIDTDENGVYDNIFVFEYDVYVFGKIADSIISDVTGKKNLDLKADTIEEVAVRNANGEFIGLEDIKDKNVLSVVIHNGICDINVSEKIAAGYVSVSQNELTVEDSQYKISAVLMSAMPTLGNGDRASVYLDISGTAYYMDVAAAVSENFGYLIDAKKAAGIAGEVDVKLYTPSGKFEYLQFANKVNLNGNSVSDIVAALSENGAVKPQLIKYSLDADGKVKTVLTAADELTSMENGFYKSYSNPSNTKLEYIGGIRAFGGIVFVDNSTKLMLIPDDVTDETSFDILKLNQLMTYGYVVEAYNSSKSQATAEYVIFKGNIPYMTYENRLSVVLTMRKKMVNEEERTEIEYFQSGAVVKSVVADNVDTSVITEGDICRFGLDSTGVIKEIEPYFDMDSNRYVATSNPTGAYGNSFRVTYGTVAAINGDIMRVTTLNEDRIPDTSKINQYEGYRLSSFIDVIMVNNNGKEVTAVKGNIADVTKFDKVMIQTRGALPRVLIIIRGNE